MPCRQARFFDPLTERHLLESLQCGDEAAFKTIYTTYRKPLLRHAMNFTQSRCRAEDAVQDVCLKVWTDRATLTVRTTLTGYLFQAVRNRVYDLGRRDARLVMEPLPMEEDAVAVLGFAREDAEDDARYSDFVRVVTRVVLSLTPQVRRAFLLSWYDGMTYDMIAERLSLTVSTVRQHLINARDRCWDALILVGVVDEYQRTRGHHGHGGSRAIEREVEIPLYHEPSKGHLHPMDTADVSTARVREPLDYLIDRVLSHPL